MQLHELQPENSRKTKKRVGRGGKRGKTAGRGTKGQKARAGGTPRPQIRDRIKKIPKLRGYNFNSVKTKPVAVNIETLEANFAASDVVSPRTLVRAEVVRKRNGQIPNVKILAGGELTKKLTVVDCQLSGAAREAIQAAGGTVKEGGQDSDAS